MKSKILLSFVFVGILGIGQLSAQVVEKKEPPKKEFRQGEKKDERKKFIADKKHPRKDFRSQDKRKIDERRKWMANRDRKDKQIVMLHKDCKECMKLNKKMDKHKVKKHPAPSRRVR